MTESGAPAGTGPAQSRISAIVGPGGRRSTGTIVTTADLAFVDAAIELLRASRGFRDEAAGMVAVDDVASENLVFVVSDITTQGEVTFKVVNTGLIGDDLAVVRLAERIGLAPTVSLERLIGARNTLAKGLQQGAEQG